MKRIFSIIFCLIFFQSKNFSQNVGIGNASPLLRLHITGGLLLDGGPQ